LRVEQNDDLFLTGDQPDPLASEDSHNFGPISRDAVIARCTGEGKRA
jgi:type IV secretory pathway protease TraF